MTRQPLRRAARGACLLAAGALLACAPKDPPPEIVGQTPSQVSVRVGLTGDPKPLARAYCAQYGKRPVLRDTTASQDTVMRGWSTGTKVFVITFDCM